MLFYIWVCVVMQAFVPGGARIADHHVNAVQAYVRAQIETLEDAIAPPIPIEIAPALTPTQRVRRARTNAVALAR